MGGRWHVIVRRRKLCLWGRILPRGERVMEKGSKEVLGISHVVPLPHVVHQGKMGPIPVVINVRKRRGSLMQANKEKCGGHVGITSELPRSCCEW